MIASVPFLERLAPGIAEHGPVRPALPPRFAPVQLETPLGEPVLGGPFGAPAAISRDEPVERFERRGPEVLPRFPQRDHRLEPSSEQNVVLAASAHRPGIADQAPPMMPNASVMIPPGPGISPSAVSNGLGSLFRSNPDRGSVMRDTAGPTAISVTPAATPFVAARPPLPEPVARQRAAVEARRVPTEVHVTIDRIDVRAPPAVNGGPAQPVSKPRASPSLSLADYLRQRQQARNLGGVR